MDKICLDCGTSLLGRSDKKFCGDMCRNSWNNRIYSSQGLTIRKINRILTKNRLILAGLVPEEKAKVNRATLARLGFNFHYFTNTSVTRTGNTYYFCYEFGYLELEHDQFLLVKRQLITESRLVVP